MIPHQGVTSHLRTPRAPVSYKFPINVTLEDGLPRFAPGRVGEAMSFDGKRFINAGDIANFTYAEPFTVGAWIYPTAADGVIVSRALAGDQGEQGWGLYLLEGKLQVNLSQRYADDGLRIESVDTLPLNEWQHVMFTYDGQAGAGELPHLRQRPVAGDQPAARRHQQPDADARAAAHRGQREPAGELRRHRFEAPVPGHDR